VCLVYVESEEHRETERGRERERERERGRKVIEIRFESDISLYRFNL
jgi:hypothetical protein